MIPDPEAAEDILHIAANIVGLVFEDVTPEQMPEYISVALQAIQMTEVTPAGPGARLRARGRAEGGPNG